MARLPDNYFGPKQRITKLKADYPGTQSSIQTSVVMLPMGEETLCVLVKAVVTVNGQVIAEAHAFTGEPENDKAVEKAETIAIGRALVNAGYPETLDEVGGEEYAAPAPKQSKPAPKGLGLGAKKKAPAKVETEEETEETEDEEAPVEKAPAKKPAGLGNKLGSRAAKPSVQETSSTESDDAGESEEEAEEEAEETPPADLDEKAAAAKAKREALLAKYKK